MNLMRKVKITVGLVLAASTAFFGGIVEQRLGIPESLRLGILMFLVMLLSYPAVKWWYEERRRKITFKQWTLMAAVATVASTAIHFIIEWVIG
jgi:sensor domain CHASE-containing protein